MITMNQLASIAYKCNFHEHADLHIAHIHNIQSTKNHEIIILKFNVIVAIMSV